MEGIETKLATHLYSQSHSGTLFQFLQKIYPIKKMSALAKRIRRWVFVGKENSEIEANIR